MIVERIRKLNIDKRPIFTGIYGHSYGQEYFVEDNLCKYNLWHELYRYLRSEGYTTVFYNTDFNFFSYEESQLETLFLSKPDCKSVGGSTNLNGRFIAPIASPNGHNRRRGIRLGGNHEVDRGNALGENKTEKNTVQVSNSADLVSHHPGAILVANTETDHFYQWKSSLNVMDRILNFTRVNPGHKLAVVFTMPSAISFGPEGDSALTHLQAKYSQQRQAGSFLRLIVCYDFKDVTALREAFRYGGNFFFNNWFQNQMFPDYREDRPDVQRPSDALFHVGKIGKDEVANVLKRRRIMEGLQHTLAPIPFDELCSQISKRFRVKSTDSNEARGIDTVMDLMALDKDVLEQQLLKVDCSNNSDAEILTELNKMIGLQNVKDALRGIIANVKAKQSRSNLRQTNEGKVGLNFIFRGNPGTGKTTVARLLGKILAHYGLIDNPEVVTYSRGKLIDGYEGGPSRNVEKMFEESVGKVLFIDEAYQLSSDNGNNEALDALTNMMTDERFHNRLAIVLAGYAGKMATLINANPGLRTRFTQYIDFEDYSNDELTEIFYRKLQAESFEVSEKTLLYAKAYFTSLRRNEGFGNGREAANLVDIVKTNQALRLQDMKKPTSSDFFTVLPQDFPGYGKINVDTYRPQQRKVSTAMDKLNKFIGIDEIRRQFEEYLGISHYFQKNPHLQISSSFRPHMAFLGNPGTGKTTVARLFAEILRERGLLSNKNFVELGPDDLIGKYVGHSAPKAREQFERARGGVLFIDEVYEIYKKGKEGGGNQFGQEVITALIKFMEDERDTIVILAGYTDETRYLIHEGNPGLASRVTNEFIFKDYEPEVLLHILLQKLNEFNVSDEFLDDMREIIVYEYEHRNPKNWGNGRTMENYAIDIFRNFHTKHQAVGVIGSDCIPNYLQSDLMRNKRQHVVNVTKGTNQSPEAIVSVPSVNLTTNPAENRVANPTMLKERATGLLSSSAGEGTAFVISVPEHYILTCSHVIEGAGGELSFMMNCNREFKSPAHVVWNNYENDLALLQVDDLPEDACYIQLDDDINHQPQELTELVLCGYPDGSAFASTPSLISGTINNYEKNHEWNDRCFDTIYANVSATYGCSGGPVVRKSDMVLVGILQGGKEGGEIQFITDIHQLFKHINIKQ